MPRRGLEPPRPCERQHLKLVRLPIPPPGHGRDELESAASLVNYVSCGRAHPSQAGVPRVFLTLRGRGRASDRGGTGGGGSSRRPGDCDGFRRIGFCRPLRRGGAGQTGLARARRRAPPGSRRLPAAGGSRRAGGARAGQPALPAVGAAGRRSAPSSSSTPSACSPAAASRRSAPSTSRARAPSPRRRARPACAISCTSRPSAPIAKSPSRYARSKASRRGGRAGGVPRRRHRAPVDRLRSRGPVLQPLRRHGAHVAAAAAHRRRSYALPAGVRRRSGRCHRRHRRRAPASPARSTRRAVPKCCPSASCST